MNSRVRVGSVGSLALMRPAVGWSDASESPQRPATRIVDGVCSFAPAPLQDDMATVVVQVTPAAASEVAA
jgi:hypothetical protein